MNRSLIVYAGLLLGASGWAYQTWTHQDELARQDQVVLLPGTPEQISSVVYRSDRFEIAVEAREDERGRYLWGRWTPGDSPEPEPSAEAGEPSESPDAEPEEFKLGQSGNDWLDNVAPLVAKRRLEGVKDEDLDALGLAQPESTLEITREGREPKRFEINSEKFGGSYAYMRDPDNGAIYLVDGAMIRSLQNAQRAFPDRELSGIDERDVERIVVRVGDRQVSLTQHHPDDLQARYWSMTGEDEKNPQAAIWADRALRMRSSRYVPTDEVPTDMASAFDFTVVGQDDTEVKVEVFHVFDSQGQEQFFARSKYTRSLVALSRAAASEVFVDLQATLDSGGASKGPM